MKNLLFNLAVIILIASAVVTYGSEYSFIYENYPVICVFLCLYSFFLKIDYLTHINYLKIIAVILIYIIEADLIFVIVYLITPGIGGVIVLIMFFLWYVFFIFDFIIFLIALLWDIINKIKKVPLQKTKDDINQGKLIEKIVLAIFIFFFLLFVLQCLFHW